MAANVEKMFYVRETPWHGRNPSILKRKNQSRASK